MSERNVDERFEAEGLEWGSDDFQKKEDSDQAGGNFTKIPYMEFKEAGDYQIRLIGNSVKFLRHWKPFPKGSRIITAPQLKSLDPAWQAKFYPRQTFAILCIDRADGQIKILEKGKTIFESFDTWGRRKQKNPGGPEGIDFCITVKKGKRPVDTTYTVANEDPTPFTKEEKTAIKEILKDMKLDEFMKKRYMSTPLSKIIEEWEKIPEEFRIKKEEDEDGKTSNTTEPKSSGNVAPPSSKPKENTQEQSSDESAEDGALFGDDDDPTSQW